MIKQEDILSTGNIELLAKKAVEGFITGYHKSPFHGFSVEFAEHRQHNTGESIRNIDWKLYGRTDKLFVKRFEEETNLRCRILIDSSASMQQAGSGSLTKLQYAAWTSAVFLTMLKKQRDAAGLTLFKDKVVESTKISSSIRHYKELMSMLENTLHAEETPSTTNIADVLHQVAEQIHRRSMIILFTDFFERERDLPALYDALQHLKYNKHEVIVFNTIHKPTELDFNFGSRPVTFEDLESGDTIKLQPSEVKDAYMHNISQYLKNIQLKLSQYKIDFAEADTSKGVEHVLIPFLVKRSRMQR